MSIVYNAQGESKTLDAVDAREHIATGRWSSSPPAATVESEAPAAVETVTEEAPAAVEHARRGRPPGAR